MELGLFALTVEENISTEGKGLFAKRSQGKESESGSFEDVMSELVAGSNLVSEYSNIPLSQFPVVKRCGSSGGFSVQEITPRNCPLPDSSCGITQSSFQSSNNINNVALNPLLTLDFENAVSEFLDEVQNLNFSADMGELGKVELSGGKNESGEFQFQISGSKEALARLLGRLLAVVAGFTSATGASADTEECGTSTCGTTCLDNCSTQDALFDLQLEELTVNEGSVEEAVAGDGVDPQLQGTGTTFSEADVAFSEENIQLTQAEGQSLDAEIDGDFNASSEGNVVPEEDAISEQAPEDKVLLTIEKGDASGNEETLSRRGMSAGEKADVSNQRRNFTVGEDSAIAHTGNVRSGEVFSGENLKVSMNSEADIEKLFDRVFQVLSAGKGTKQVTIQLEPQKLGKIVVSLTEHNDKICCVWHVEHPETRELLESSLPLLEARAASQGMNLESFVSQQNHYSGDREQFANFATFDLQRNSSERDYQKDFSVHSWLEGKLNLVV